MKTLQLASLLAVFAVSLASAETPARIRYSQLLRIAQFSLSDVDGVEAQLVGFSTRSTLEGVSPCNIQLAIHTQAGPISLALDSAGNFTLPVTDALRKEDPWIVANQPKGSLVMATSFTTQMQVSPEFDDGEWRVRYSSLFPMAKALDQIYALSTEISKKHEVRTTVPMWKSVTIENADDLASAKLVVGNRVSDVQSPFKGEFIIKFDPTLMKTDAWVVVDPANGWTLTPQSESISSIKKAGQ